MWSAGAPTTTRETEQHESWTALRGLARVLPRPQPLHRQARIWEDPPKLTFSAALNSGTGQAVQWANNEHDQNKDRCFSRAGSAV